MQIEFFKYQGTGNDFVILDNRNGTYSSLNKNGVAALCDRRFGVGADGLMLLNKHLQYDFEMKYYNADGGESSMCGNGGRCLVKAAFDFGLIKDSYTFIAVDGIHQASIEKDGTVALKMNDVTDIKSVGNDFVLDTGSPHYVQFTDDVAQLNVFQKGHDIRYSNTFQDQGINVNFVERTNAANNIIVRTYERGVEDETFSCGTGVTAAALVCYKNETGFNSITVQTKGGILQVDYEKNGINYTNIWLKGSAEKVFEGTLQLASI